MKFLNFAHLRLFSLIWIIRVFIFEVKWSCSSLEVFIGWLKSIHFDLLFFNMPQNLSKVLRFYFIQVCKEIYLIFVLRGLSCGWMDVVFLLERLVDFIIQNLVILYFRVDRNLFEVNKVSIDWGYRFFLM